MKHLFTVLLTFLFSLVTLAQADEPYAPYRPGTYYRYENTMPVPDWGEDTPLTSPVVEMVWPRDPGLFEDWFYGYQALAPQPEPGTYNFLAHFAGYLDEYQESGTLEISSLDGLFKIQYAAAPGESYMATANLRARVDSIVEETFLGLTDSIKYISIADTSGLIPTRSIKLGKEYGMIEAIFFDEPTRFTNTYPLIGISHEDTKAGEILTPDMVGMGVDQDEYYVRSERASTRGGLPGKQVTLERYRLQGQANCDPVLDLSFASFTVKEINFFLPDNGDRASDTVANPTRGESLEVDLLPTENNWTALPIGHIIDLNGGRVAMILPASDDCLGSGKRLSRRFKRAEEGHYVLITTDQPGPARFPNVFLQSGEDLGTQDISSKIIGLQANHTTCGEIIDFNPFYSSLHDFPDDPRIAIFPNPAETMVRIEVPMDLGPTSLEVYDVAGRRTSQTNLSNGNHTLSVNEWARGIYTVIIRGEYGPVGRRRVVVR